MDIIKSEKIQYYVMFTMHNKRSNEAREKQKRKGRVMHS